MSPRPGASLDVISSVLSLPPDEGYAAAAARRAAAGSSEPKAGENTTPVRRSHAAAGLLTVGIGVLLAVAALTLRPPTTAAAEAKSQLVAQIDARRAAVESQQVALAAVRAEIETLSQGALNQSGSMALASQAARAAEQAGLTEVTGPGVVLVLDDAESAQGSGGNGREGGGGSAGRVQARDLQQLVNVLWAAGAEGIEINGHRLTATASIRFAGAAIVVAYRPLTRPYTVSAIGPNGLLAALSRGPGGEYLDALRAFGIRGDVSAADGIRLPAATAISARIATAASESPAASRPSTGSGGAR